MTNLTAIVREVAQANYYRASWDVVARMGDTELAAVIAGAKTRRGAIAKAWGAAQSIDQARDLLAHGPRPVKALSLFAFLASKGGVRPCPDLQYLLDGRPFTHKGPLVRAAGLTLDRAREAAVHAGYLQDTPWEGGVSTSTINDLLDAIADEARGSKRYPVGQEPIEFAEGDTDDCPF